MLSVLQILELLKPLTFLLRFNITALTTIGWLYALGLPIPGIQNPGILLSLGQFYNPGIKTQIPGLLNLIIW